MMEYVQLNDGNKIPAIGFGVFMIPNDGPTYDAVLAALKAGHNWNTGYYYDNIITGNGHGKASDCVKCGKCERVCPQHLEIRNLLTKVAATFDR